MWARLLATAALRRGSTPSTSGRSMLASTQAWATRSASTRVRVRLTAPVDGLGAPGDAAAVRPGHARNYLIPQGLAVLDVPAGGRRRRAVAAEGATATTTTTPSTTTTTAADAAAADAAVAQRRLASVVRQLTRGEVEIVRASSARDGAFKPPLAAPEVCAAVADQKRISLDPSLFVGTGLPITRQGRHALPLRILGADGERVVLNVAVGAAIGPTAGAEEAGGAGAAGRTGGGGGRKK